MSAGAVMRAAVPARLGTIPSPLRFAGYAALFDRRDGGGDIVRRGAFAAALLERRGPVPLLWQHRPEIQIGTVEQLAEDERGLRVIGRIALTGSRPAGLVRQRRLTGLSFGYRARRFRTDRHGRVLQDVELLEISLVQHPLQDGARIHLLG